jgi:transcriptional regulator with XRE-family HTH domain
VAVERDRKLGDRIRSARKAAGYRNAESLAVALGVGQRTVQRWETGESEPSVRRVNQIAVLTGRPLVYFVGAEPEEAVA